MCGRYTSTSTVEQLVEVYEVDEVRTDQLALRWNVAPSQPVYAVAARRRRRDEGAVGVHRQLGTFRWGLVPSWAKDPSVGNRMINARSDSLAERPAFRAAFARRRCIIPADAFYEWQAPAPPNPGGAAPKRGKVPWAVRLRNDRPMAFAGLWEVWRDGADGGEVVRSCAVITTDANGLLAPIHSRMPVVLPATAWDQWLDPAFDDIEALAELLVPAPDEWFETFVVSSRVNAVANEGPELLEPAPPPETVDADADADADADGDRGAGVQAALFDAGAAS